MNEPNEVLKEEVSTIVLSLPESLAAEIKTTGEKLELTESEVVTQAVRNFIERNFK